MKSILNDHHFLFKAGFEMINMAHLTVLINLVLSMALRTCFAFDGFEITGPTGRVKTFK
jgi:hypothetical protein